MLKDFCLNFATEKGKWALNVFLAFWPRYCWWWTGGKYNPFCEGGMFLHLEWSAGRCWWTFLPDKPQVSLFGCFFFFQLFQRRSLCYRITEDLLFLYILILVIPWEPDETRTVPFCGQGAWCHFSHAFHTTVPRSFSNSAGTQMWSSKADANYYTNKTIVAFSCSTRFIASPNSINHSKSLEFLKYKEEISSVHLQIPRRPSE